jgi:hypothetical protein
MNGALVESASGTAVSSVGFGLSRRTAMSWHCARATAIPCVTVPSARVTLMFWAPSTAWFAVSTRPRLASKMTPLTLVVFSRYLPSTEITPLPTDAREGFSSPVAVAGSDSESPQPAAATASAATRVAVTILALIVPL